MKKKRKSKAKRNAWLSLLGVLAVGTGSWAFYNVINQGVADILLNLFGIENFYLQNGIVIGIILLGLWLTGKSLIKAFKRLANG